MKRWQYYVKNYPRVWKRWWVHWAWIFWSNKFQNAFPPTSVKEWFSDFVFYSIDLLLFPFWYEIIWNGVRLSIRPLEASEEQEARKIFGSSLVYELIRVDTKPWIGLGKDVVAYVTFFTIKYKRKIAMPILIHELVHVWQYQQFGSVYIGKALKAQLSKDGYNYGGAEHLYQGMLCGKHIFDFNFEQQAEILEDYYRIIHSKNHSPMEANVYNYFAGMIKNEGWLV